MLQSHMPLRTQKRLRSVIREAILSTNMKRHKDMVDELKNVSRLLP